MKRILGVVLSMAMIAIMAPASALAAGSGSSRPVSLRGHVSNIDAATVTFVLDSKTTVHTDNSTKFVFNKEAVSFSTLMAGEDVTVRATASTDGSYMASNVHLHRRHRSLRGDVEAVNASAGTMKIKGVTVRVAANTKLTDSNSQPASLSSFVVGDRAVAKGYMTPDGTLQATDVQRLLVTRSFRGKIKAVDAAAKSIQVGKHTFVMDAAAKIELDGNTASLADLKQGQHVVIKAWANGDKWMATSVIATN